MARPKDTFGSVGRTTSGPFYARYIHNGKRHTPGRTFATEQAAWKWLREERRLLDLGQWESPAERRRQDVRESLTLGVYAQDWLHKREVGGRALRPRTKELYQSLFDRWLLGLWDVPLQDISREICTQWYLSLPKDSPTMRAHAYALTRSVLKSAVDDELIPKNPLYIRGAGRSAPTTGKVELFTATEIGQLASLMPDQHRLMVLLAAWCGLRFGELAALRRSDITVSEDGRVKLKVHHGVVTLGASEKEQKETGLKHKRVLGDPKTHAGVREVIIPKHIIPNVKAHLQTWARRGDDGLVFPPSSRSAQQFVTPMQVYGHASRRLESGRIKPGYGYYGARETLARTDLSFHMLRHFAGTNYAVVGATSAELLDMMGHTDIRVAQRYQHAARSRAEELADKLAALGSLDEMSPGD